VTSGPYQHPSDQESEWDWRVDVKILDEVPFIHQGPKIDVMNVVEGRDIRLRIRRRSHVHLLSEEYAEAVKALADRRKRI